MKFAQVILFPAKLTSFVFYTRKTRAIRLCVEKLDLDFTFQLKIQTFDLFLTGNKQSLI
jgi:uncharacterized protein YpmS